MMDVVSRVAARYRQAEMVARIVARIASHESDMTRSLNSLIKSNGGLFKSPKQAAFLYNSLRSSENDVAKAWGRPYMTSPDALAVGFSFLMEDFGRKDVSRRRYYGWLYVVDGAGVVAAAKAECDHATGALLGAKETIFERRGEAPALYTKPAERPKAPVDTKLVEEIRALPDFDNSDILNSFVQQLEKGRTLSPAQLAILQRKFGLGVSLGVETDRYVQLYKKLSGEIQKLYKALIDALEEISRERDPGEQRLYRDAIRQLEEDLAAAKKEKVLQRFKDYDTPKWYMRDVLGFPIGPNGEGPVGYLARVGILAAKGEAAPKTTLRVIKPLEKFERWLEHVGGKAQIEAKIRAYIKKRDADGIKSYP